VRDLKTPHDQRRVVFAPDVLSASTPCLRATALANECAGLTHFKRMITSTFIARLRILANTPGVVVKRFSDAIACAGLCDEISTPYAAAIRLMSETNSQDFGMHGQKFV